MMFQDKSTTTNIEIEMRENRDADKTVQQLACSRNS